MLVICEMLFEHQSNKPGVDSKAIEKSVTEDMTTVLRMAACNSPELKMLVWNVDRNPKNLYIVAENAVPEIVRGYFDPNRVRFQFDVESESLPAASEQYVGERILKILFAQIDQVFFDEYELGRRLCMVSTISDNIAIDIRMMCRPDSDLPSTLFMWAYHNEDCRVTYDHGHARMEFRNITPESSHVAAPEWEHLLMFPHVAALSIWDARIRPILKRVKLRGEGMPTAEYDDRCRDILAQMFDAYVLMTAPIVSDKGRDISLDASPTVSSFPDGTLTLAYPCGVNIATKLFTEDIAGIAAIIIYEFTKRLDCNSVDAFDIDAEERNADLDNLIGVEFYNQATMPQITMRVSNRVDLRYGLISSSAIVFAGGCLVWDFQRIESNSAIYNIKSIIRISDGYDAIVRLLSFGNAMILDRAKYLADIENASKTQ